MTDGIGAVKVLSESPEWVGTADATVFVEKKTPQQNKALLTFLSHHIRNTFQQITYVYT